MECKSQENGHCHKAVNNSMHVDTEYVTVKSSLLDRIPTALEISAAHSEASFLSFSQDII